MADEKSIFESGETIPDPKDTSAPTIVIPDNVKEMIGDGKKYADVSKALEALGYSQEHIARIERENAELREKAGGGLSQDDVLKTVKDILAEERKTFGAPAQVDEAALTRVVDSALDRKLTMKEEAAIANANTEVVKKAMLAKYGEKAEEQYKAKAGELGVGVKFLNDLVAKSPAAAFKLFGLDSDKPNAGTATHGSVNSAAFREQVPATPPAKSIMRGASTADILAEFRRHKPTQE